MRVSESLLYVLKTSAPRAESRSALVGLMRSDEDGAGLLRRNMDSGRGDNGIIGEADLRRSSNEDCP